MLPWRDLVSLVSVLFSGMSALTSLLIWCLARKHFKHVRTASYIERYNTADSTRLRAEVDQFLYLTEKLTPAARGQVYKELLLSDHLTDMEFRHKLWTFTMLYNEIGLAWKTQVIQDDLVSNFDRLIPRYWMRLRTYIMNLHLRFDFEVPIDEQGFKSEFKLFKGFHHAYIEICKHAMAIMPQDLETSSLLSKENYTPLEHVMIHGRPDQPCRLGDGRAVLDELRSFGYLNPSPPTNP